jgi:hypothetical protein
MATTPLWLPLAAAGLAVVGTLAGVIFTQAWNSRLEERRWAREAARLREDHARENLNRTYEHRRAAYGDFQTEVWRLRRMFGGEDQEPATLDDPRMFGLEDLLTVVQIYGTPESVQLANKCFGALYRWARRDDTGEEVMHAQDEYLDQIRKDLGVPEQQPAGE